MANLPVPKLIVSQRFKDIEQLSTMVGWEVDFRQIDHDSLDARATFFGHEKVAVLRVEFSRSFHQIGSPPSRDSDFWILG